MTWCPEPSCVNHCHGPGLVYCWEHGFAERAARLVADWGTEDLRDPCCWLCTPDYRGFLVCGTCGNKRCPHATSHLRGCTDSNEPGQAGSVYAPLSPEAAAALEAGIASAERGEIRPMGSFSTRTTNSEVLTMAERTKDELLRSVQGAAASCAEWRTVGDALFAIEIADGLLDFGVWELVSEILTWKPEKIGHDYYDRSLEIYGAPEGFACSLEQLAQMWALGIDKFWTHVHPEHSREPGERCYQSPALIARYAAVYAKTAP